MAQISLKISHSLFLCFKLFSHWKNSSSNHCNWWFLYNGYYRSDYWESIEGTWVWQHRSHHSSNSTLVLPLFQNQMAQISLKISHSLFLCFKLFSRPDQDSGRIFLNNYCFPAIVFLVLVFIFCWKFVVIKSNRYDRYVRSSDRYNHWRVVSI